MKTVLYTMPNCPQCDATKRYFEEGEIDYSTVDLSINEEAYELVSSFGYKSAPVVISGENHWSGFRPDKIKLLKLIKDNQ